MIKLIIKVIFFFWEFIYIYFPSFRFIQGFDNLRSDQPSCQVNSGKVITHSEFLKSDYPVICLTVFKENYSREDLEYYFELFKNYITWMFSLAVKKGVFSALILTKSVSECVSAMSLRCFSMILHRSKPVW